MLLRASKLLYFLLVFIHVNLLQADLLDEISNKGKILDAKDAFKLSLLVNQNKSSISWEIAPKHYLYLDDISIKLNETFLGFTIEQSSQSSFEDAFFGNVEILKEIFKISFLTPVPELEKKDIIVINYRGCAEAGFCYPMESFTYRISDKIL